MCAGAGRTVMGFVHFAALGLLGLTMELSAGVLVLQSPKCMVVTAGESATLSCAVSSDLGNGAVRWYKGSGKSSPLIYSTKQDEGLFPRASQASPGSNTNMSIRIYNLTSEDTGTYYCVKFQKRPAKEKQYESGRGTCLFVSGECAQKITVLQSPEAIHVTAGDLATFSCTISVAPYTFLIGPVRWYKGSREYRTLIYSDEVSVPHVSRVSPKSSTDWSIRIANISIQDTGTYYCVKFVRSASQEEEHTSGTGISLSVSVGAPGSSGVYVSSQALWIGFLVEKLCLMAFVLGVLYLKQRK